MERLGNVSVREELQGTKIHGLNNVLTLDLTVHRAFDNLELCLEFQEMVGVFLPSYYIFLQVFNFDSRLVS